jgi:hypothetical protein
MRYEIEATHTEALIRSTTLRLINRWIGAGLYMAMAAVAAALVYLAAVGDRSGFIPVLGTVVALAVSGRLADLHRQEHLPDPARLRDRRRRQGLHRTPNQGGGGEGPLSRPVVQPSLFTRCI